MQQESEHRYVYTNLESRQPTLPFCKGMKEWSALIEKGANVILMWKSCFKEVYSLVERK